MKSNVCWYTCLMMMIFFSLTPCQAVLKYWAAKAVTGKFAIKETRIDTLVSEWLALREEDRKWFVFNPALHLDLPSFIRFSLTAQAVHCSVQLLLRPCAHIGCAYILYMVRTCSEFRWWWSWFALNKGLFSCEKRQHDYRGWLLWLRLHPENHTGGSWCFLVNFQKRSGVKNCDLEKRHSRFWMNRWMMMI